MAQGDAHNTQVGAPEALFNSWYVETQVRQAVVEQVEQLVKIVEHG